MNKNIALGSVLTSSITFKNGLQCKIFITPIRGSFFLIKSVFFLKNIHLMQSVVHNQPKDPHIQITIHRVATM